MMDFLELAAARYSVRRFDGRPLSPEDEEKILRAGILAPTAKNLQPERIYLLKSAGAIEKLKTCTRCGYGAKTAFLVCFDRSVSWKRDTDGADSGPADAAIAASHMMLEAASLGAGTTWVMWFDAQKAREAFRLPENIVPVCILVAGYPAADAQPSANHASRKAEKDIVTEL